MRELSTEIEIDAPPADVWRVLTDSEAYPEWNPFIRKLEGDLRPGERLEVRIEPPGGRGMTFKPKVLAAEPERELRWLGRLLVPGVFDGEHILRIEPIGESRSRFVQAERFRGLLVGMAGAGTLEKTKEGFERMNAALKERVEQSRTAPASGL
jgi:hypothetical protein